MTANSTIFGEAADTVNMVCVRVCVCLKENATLTYKLLSSPYYNGPAEHRRRGAEGRVGLLLHNHLRWGRVGVGGCKTAEYEESQASELGHLTLAAC